MGVYFNDEAIRQAEEAERLKAKLKGANREFWEAAHLLSQNLIADFVKLFGNEPKDEAAQEFLELLKKHCLGAKIALSEIYGCDLIELL